MTDFINATTLETDAMDFARDAADELGLPTPDQLTSSFLTTLSATCCQDKSAVVISPAACVSGLAILAGMGPQGHVTCIDTEAVHQRVARQAFNTANIPSNQYRFLPSRPLEVMTRLAAHSYSLIYAEVPPVDASTLVDQALDLLEPGGLIVLADMLLDGTIANPARKDRDTASARQLDESLRNRDDLRLSRLPLGAGMVIISRC
ncbi:O-methyltransferase [Corynebacterium kroppenstedtii]|uniref:O-methyltransferase n=1 Tax=Corynebacterium sp. PCR 32 TaxID=3351342 RepID=UPI0030A32192